MTTLAAFQGNGFAIIGADSRATDGGGGAFVLSNAKVSWNGDYIFAVSGASRGGNLIQQGWTPPKPPVTTDINKLDIFMTKKFIPAMRDLFVDAGYDAKDDGDSAWHDGNFLVALNGVIYPIFEDYSWDRDARNIYYGGSGGDVALGAMSALGIEKCKDDPEKAKKIITKAIEISTQWNAYCMPPVLVETQFA